MTGLVFSEVLSEMAAILHVSFRRLIRLRTEGRMPEYHYIVRITPHSQNITT